MKFWKKQSSIRCSQNVNPVERQADRHCFGSYGWGSGEWMESWTERAEDDNASLVCESVICNEMPDDEGLEQCRALGKALV